MFLSYMVSEWVIAAIIIYQHTASCLFEMYHIFLVMLGTNKIKHLCVSGWMSLCLPTHLFLHSAKFHFFFLVEKARGANCFGWIIRGARAWKRTHFDGET